MVTEAGYQYCRIPDLAGDSTQYLVMVTEVRVQVGHQPPSLEEWSDKRTRLAVSGPKGFCK